ncbi:uncharacterized protein Dana_GF18266, isoform B [Drosophila ananassae]|uniref:Uncharacterized protein, isoform B n=1 Tax=Drosophila ananassae TaxID=7217 RepID=B3LZ83_DROAN|nr:uncharacterized protein Dana_GF18266, isoform B [Drosophila ananassae]
MNFEYIGHALGYHGQPMQKIWDDERGVDDLRLMGLTQVNYSVYQERQKYLTFQERAKRLKMHQFLARKATDLYDRSLVANVMEDKVLAQGKDSLVVQPPYEFFLSAKDKRKAWTQRLESLKQGDIIYASVVKVTSAVRLMVKPLCTAEPVHSYLADIPIKALIIQDYWGPMPRDKQGNPRAFTVNEIVRCEICNISAETERVTLNMLGMYNKSPDLKLGLCSPEDLPKYYKKIHNLEHPSPVHYEDQLTAALEFQNPNYDALFQMNGLQPNENLTLMSHLKAGFPDAEYATELRQKQASQWAFRSVADGIEHFKNGQQVEAFQCLNKALNIDPRNVEGLVARGALYANRGSFLKGLQDFEKALNLNKYHVNARKYMGETLVALGRSYEEENRIPEAVKAYSDCLNLLPQHEEARQSLDVLQRPPFAGPSGSGIVSGDGKPRLSTASGGHSSDESSSSSASDSETEDQTTKGKVNFHQPFYAQSQAAGGDKLAVIDAQKANEFRLDDDETVSSVRKLLREASKHKKAKKKGKKKKDKKEKKPKSKAKEEDPVEMLKKLDFNEAYRLMSSVGNEAELKAKLKNYLQQQQGGSDSPPPAPPTIKRTTALEKRANFDDMGPSTSRHAVANSSTSNDVPPPAPKFQEQRKPPPQPIPKLSFQIKKRPLQMDKFGLIRLAAPPEGMPTSRSTSSRSRSRSHSRSRSRSRHHRRRRGSRRRSSTPKRKSRPRSPSKSRTRSRSRFRSRQRSRSRRQRSFSRSRSRSHSPRRYGRGRFVSRHSRSRSQHRRKMRSPFVKRRTPSPFDPRRSPSRSPESRHRRHRSRSWSRSRSRSRSRNRSRSYSPYRFSGRFQSRGGRGRGRGRFNNKYGWFSHDSRPDSGTESNGRDRKRSTSPEEDSPPQSSGRRVTSAGGNHEERTETIKEDAQKVRSKE